jgi:hypothetical protein
MKRIATAIVLVLSLSSYTFAQNQNYINDGTAFGRSIAPTRPGQIVNPAAVNPSAWTGNTSSSSTVPSGLGAFSNPTTSSAALDSGRAIGLAGLGNQAMDNCAAYVPGSGDAARDQECAAVNFLSQRCLISSGPQALITNSNGGSAQSQLNSSYCAGSYGQGANKYDFAGQVTTTDSVFGAVTGAQTNAGTATGQVCTQKTVVTKPAEFEINTCVKSRNTDVAACSQFLKVRGVQEPGCTDGQFLTQVIADPCPGCTDKLVWDYTCTATGYRMHFFTILKSNGAIYMEGGSRDIAGRVGFAMPRTLGPSVHSDGFCYSTYYTQSCTGLACSITSEFYNECKGTSYSGSNGFAVPTITKYESYWDNQCTTLEQNAGISLGTP